MTRRRRVGAVLVSLAAVPVGVTAVAPRAAPAASPPAAPPTAAPPALWTVSTVAAPFRYPVAVAADGAGNLYVADARASTVYVVNSAGSIRPIAGTGTAGFGGDGGPGTAAQLFDPRAVAVDAKGDVFIADTGNDRVRAVAAGSDVITTVAGNGSWGLAPDGAAAAGAPLEGPDGVAVDGTGDVYFSEAAANRVRRIDASTGVLSTVAGAGPYGFSGDGGPAVAAQLSGPGALALDQSGDLFLVEAGDNRVREVTAAATIVTVAGSGQAGDAGDGGPGPAAQLDGPTGVAVDPAGDVFVTESAGQRVREVTPATGGPGGGPGVAYTVAGTGVAGGGDGGVGPSTPFADPEGVAVGPSGTVVVAAAGNHSLRGFVPPAPGGCAARLPVGTVAGVAASAGGAGGAGGGGAGAPGYVLAAADGAVATFGSAPCAGSELGRPLGAPVVGVETTPDGGGYWLVSAAGGVNTFGDAPFEGSASGIRLSHPVVGMAATPDGRGYWLVSSEGGVFSFGDAAFFGSEGATRLNRPIVAIVATPDGRGYWLVAADGGVFSFGDAPFLGSLGGLRLAQPVVDAAGVPGAAGYWMVAADGGVFTYGAARFFGSASGAATRPVTGLAPAPAGNGYWLVSVDGGVFSFGGAAFEGSAH